MMVHISIRRLGTVFDLGICREKFGAYGGPRVAISHVVVGAGLNVMVNSTDHFSLHVVTKQL